MVRSCGGDAPDRQPYGNPAALLRVLTHLVGKGVFEEPAPGRFAMNEPARALIDGPLRLGLDLDSFGGRMAHAWSSLLGAMRTGAPAYHEVFGRPFWEDLQAHPDIAASFDALMGPAGHGTPDPELQITGGWESVRSVVDVGGGTGALLAGILSAHPTIFQAAGVADRVTTVGQSFFHPLPAGADLYLLKSVLSDWPDREAQEILTRCAEAARPAGRVIVLNGVSPDESGRPSPSLQIMVLVGGKERSLGEFRDLARAAGLDVRAAARQPSGRFIVECHVSPRTPASSR